jgi:polyphenol oxidase
MWQIRTSSLGRILVPPSVPPGFAVLTTSLDFEGRITPDLAGAIELMMADELGVRATLATCNQVHGARVARAERTSSWRECDACDALWSDRQGVSLGIKVADCLPVTMIDPVHRVIANVHSGWRGAVQRIASETLDTLQRETPFEPARAHAYLGPSIRVCCFEVGDEVAARFDDAFVDRARAKPHVDLVAFTAAILRDRGFDAARISDSGVCTRCDGSLFHSFRRSGAGSGRNLHLVAQ